MTATSQGLKTFYLDSNLVGDDSLGEKLTLINGSQWNTVME